MLHFERKFRQLFGCTSKRWQEKKDSTFSQQPFDLKCDGIVTLDLYDSLEIIVSQLMRA